MQPEPICDAVHLFEEQPEKAKSKATVKAHTDGSQAVMEAGPFSWRSDLPEPIGGTNQAPSPTALLLSAPAGCAVVFIRDTLAPRLGVRVDALQATAQCEADSRGLSLVWPTPSRTCKTSGSTSGSSRRIAKAMCRGSMRLGGSVARYTSPSPERWMSPSIRKLRTHKARRDTSYLRASEKASRTKLS